MKLSEFKGELKVGAEVFDKRGLCFGFDRDLGNGEVLVEVLGLSWTQDYNGEPCGEELEGTGQFVVYSKDELWTEKPKQLVPKYLDEDIARAKQQAEYWKGLADKSRNERAALVKDTEALKKRLEGVSKKFPQLEYLCDFVEGVDLWVAGWGGYGGFELCKVSELKGDYGMRMVSIQTEKREGKWVDFFDWCLHKYSDDSGDTKHCVIGRTKEDCVKRLEEYLEKMGKTGHHWHVRVLREMQEAGVTLPEKETKYLEEKAAEQKAQEEKNQAYEKKRIKQQAEKLGLKVVE
jgi:hypothetical protein